MKVECWCCRLEATTFGLYVIDGDKVRSGSIFAYCRNHVNLLLNSIEVEITKEDYLARLAMQSL